MLGLSREIYRNGRIRVGWGREELMDKEYPTCPPNVEDTLAFLYS